MVGCAAIVIALAGGAAASHGDPGDAPNEAEGEGPTMTGSLEVVTSAERRRDLDVAAISPRLELGLRPRPQVELGLAIGAAALFANGDAGPIRAGAPSNASIGGRYIASRRRCGRRCDDPSVNARARHRSGHVGFRFSLPTAPGHDIEQAMAVEYAAVGRAGWNPWEWETGVLGLVVPAGARVQVSRRIVLGGEAAAALLVPTSDTRGVAFAGQLAVEARWVLSPLALGLRLAGVWNGREPDDRTHASVAPFVEVGLCRRGAPSRIRGVVAPHAHACPLFAGARVNVNLDRPYGFATEDPMGIWGLVVGLGWAVW